MLCSKCKLNLRQGKSSWCAECKRIASRERYKKTRERSIERAKQWAASNPESRAKIARKSYMKNIEKRKEYHRRLHSARRIDNPSYFQHRNMKLRYGLTPEQYEAMLIDQDERCAICGVIEDSLVIDHNHNTEQIRALLCQRCNKGIGHFRENVELMLKAVNYLKQFT